MPETAYNHLRFRRGFVLALTLAVSWLFFELVRPFLMALILAAISAGMLQPVYSSLVKKFGGREGIASITTVLVLFFIIVGPLAAFLGLVAGQALEVSQAAIPWVQENLSDEKNMIEVERWITERVPSLKEMMPTRSQLVQGLGDVAQKIGDFLVISISAMTAGTAAFFLQFFVMLYALFFFLIKGKAISDQVLAYSPLSSEEQEHLVERSISVTRATLKGSLVIGIIQGTLCGIGFAFVGIEGAAFWGTIMTVLSVIPGIGTALIWVPAAIYFTVTQEYGNALILLVWCGGLSGNIDNVLRPKLVGKDAKMPDLLILIGTLGGLVFFGAVGFLIGPVVCALFLAVWEIYGKTFKDVLEEDSSC